MITMISRADAGVDTSAREYGTAIEHAYVDNRRSEEVVKPLRQIFREEQDSEVTPPPPPPCAMKKYSAKTYAGVEHTPLRSRLCTVGDFHQHGAPSTT
jgi:hypothetical protein